MIIAALLWTAFYSVVFWLVISYIRTDRPVAFFFIIIVVVLSVLPSLRTSSTTISLDAPRVRMTYSVIWGWGMEQKISIRPDWPTVLAPIELAASYLGFFDIGTEDVWKKPSNAGATIYQTPNADAYYVAMGNHVYRIDSVWWGSESLCGVDDITLRLIGRFFLGYGHPGSRGADVPAFAAAENAGEFKRMSFSQCG